MRNERELKMVVRLNQLTTEYKALEQDKEKFYKRHVDDMSRTTIQTLYLMQVRIDQLIKSIVRLVEHLNNEDIDFENECAILVHDYYAPYIRRGLSDLL